MSVGRPGGRPLSFCCRPGGRPLQPVHVGAQRSASPVDRAAAATATDSLLLLLIPLLWLLVVDFLPLFLYKAHINIIPLSMLIGPTRPNIDLLIKGKVLIHLRCNIRIYTHLLKYTVCVMVPDLMTGSTTYSQIKWIIIITKVFTKISNHRITRNFGSIFHIYCQLFIYKIYQL